MFYSPATKGFYTPEIHSETPPDAIEIDEVYHDALMAGQLQGKLIGIGAGGMPILVDPPAPPLPTSDQLKAKIDAHVALIYSQWTRFESEYREREAAARAFLQPEHEGPAGVWVESFADAAGISDQAAATLIVAQADQLKAAQVSLGALRMRKYELNALSGQDAVDRADEIIQAINLVASQIS